ncbi:MAG: putative membrane protein YhiD involved in acid resistance [Kiritimatiellia bacterium]|jgi:uncharacterized membrane protein YhiD involved in acid resistance
MDEFIQPLSRGAEISSAEVIAAMILSFILASTISYIYRYTYYGLSYSRSFVHTQILASVITTMLIMAIGNNLARGMGIMGTLAIIRFRTPVRDPRDIIFLFASIAVGISAGAMVFKIAMLGTVSFCLVALYLHWSPFGSRREFEGLLRFMLPKATDAEHKVQQLFDSYCSSVQLVAMREAVQGDVMEYAYQVRLRDPSYRADLLDAMHSIPDINEVNLMMQRQTVEI